MINLNQLSKTVTKQKNKRLGRGYGSGKGGHTVGRGAKGQKARGKINGIFIGSKFRKSLVKRLPLWRGKGKLKPISPPPFILKTGQLAKLAPKSKVTLKFLVEKRLLVKTALRRGVKILDGGDLSIPLTVLVPCSAKARQKIEKAGGTLTATVSPVSPSKPTVKTKPLSAKPSSRK